MEAAQELVIELSDGVSEVEAFKLALDYFAQTRIGSGAVMLPKEEKAVWRVAILEGTSGTHSKDLLINKSDGKQRVVAAFDQ